MGLTGKAVGKNASRSDEIRKKKNGEKLVALAGNPNVGKSTVFNILTGLRQHTGNWTGKTVATAVGYYKKNDATYQIVDLPGSYSLSAHSAEEEIARDFLCFGDADAVIVVCDATRLCRNLGLVYQILEITPHVLVCVNLMDEAKRSGTSLCLEKLEELLGVPVAGTSAGHGQGVKELIGRLEETKHCVPALVTYSDPIETAVQMLMPYMEKACMNMTRQLRLSVSQILIWVIRDQLKSNLSSRKRSLRSTPSISILFSKDGKMYTVKVPESRIPKPERRVIILNAGIIGSQAFVQNMKKMKTERW